MSQALRAPKGMSLHIAVNAPDPAQFPGAPVLKGCDNDARAMARIASANQFIVDPLLLGRAATADVVKKRILYAASELQQPGDVFFLSFSGNGSRIPSMEEPQDEPLDSAWVLYDRMLLDDELYELWTKFAPGVRVLVLSDSCSSGSVISLATTAELRSETLAPVVQKRWPQRIRGLAAEIAAQAYNDNEELYRAIQYGVAQAR